MLESFYDSLVLSGIQAEVNNKLKRHKLYGTIPPYLPLALKSICHLVSDHLRSQRQFLRICCIMTRFSVLIHLINFLHFRGENQNLF